MKEDKLKKLQKTIISKLLLDNVFMSELFLSNLLFYVIILIKNDKDIKINNT